MYKLLPHEPPRPVPHPSSLQLFPLVWARVSTGQAIPLPGQRGADSPQVALHTFQPCPVTPPPEAPILG